MSGPADPVACYVRAIHFSIKAFWCTLVTPVGTVYTQHPCLTATGGSIRPAKKQEVEEEEEELEKRQHQRVFAFAFTQISSNLIFVDGSQIIKPKLESCPTWKCKMWFHFKSGVSRCKNFPISDIGEEYFISLSLGLKWLRRLTNYIIVFGDSIARGSLVSMLSSVIQRGTSYWIFPYFRMRNKMHSMLVLRHMNFLWYVRVCRFREEKNGLITSLKSLKWQLFFTPR